MKKIKRVFIRKKKRILKKEAKQEKKEISNACAAAAKWIRERKEKGLGFERLNPIERLATNPGSRPLAIRAMCYECNGKEIFLARTKHCNMFDCPLWGVRPYQKGITKEQCNEYADSDSYVIRLRQEEMKKINEQKKKEKLERSKKKLKRIKRRRNVHNKKKV